MKARRTFRRILGSWSLAALIVFASAILVLRSAAFQEYVLERMIQAAEQSTGVQIEVAHMTVKWYPLAFEFRDITGRSPEALAKKPLFTVARVRVGLRLLPLLHRRVEIESLLVEQPSAYVRTEPDGRTNLPAPRSQDPRSSALDVYVGHLSIRNGLVAVDNRRIPVSAELQGLQSKVVLDRATNSYQGADRVPHRSRRNNGPSHL
jgi:uncharacterized protein involved in outer membrane biogenesis